MATRLMIAIAGRMLADHEVETLTSDVGCNEIRSVQLIKILFEASDTVWQPHAPGQECDRWLYLVSISLHTM